MLSTNETSGGFKGVNPIKDDTRQLRASRGSTLTKNYTVNCNKESGAIVGMELEDFTMSLSSVEDNRISGDERDKDACEIQVLSQQQGN